jgi:hypothetical protein
MDVLQATHGVDDRSQAFASLQIVDMVSIRVGNNALWNVALQILPDTDGDRENPLIIRVTDPIGSQIAITRIAGVPVLVEAKNNPQRYSQAAVEFQNRWKATPTSKQTVVRRED